MGTQGGKKLAEKYRKKRRVRLSEKPGITRWEEVRTKLTILKASQEAEGKGCVGMLPDAR